MGKGLNVNSTTHDGTSAFHWAVWQGHMHVCKWMVYLGGCDFASTNSFGCNAIQWAAQTADVGMCRWLAAIGLDVRIINRNGHSALHKAAGKGQRATCEWLINEECLGADHMRADGDGNTPAVMARLEGFTALAAELEAAERALAEGVPEGSRGPFGGAPEAGDAPRDTRRDVGMCTRLARLQQLAGEVRMSSRYRDVHVLCVLWKGGQACASRWPVHVSGARAGWPLQSHWGLGRNVHTAAYGDSG